MLFLEKIKDINAIKLDIPWSDLGSWKEICLMYNRNKAKYFKKQILFIGRGEDIPICIMVKIS